MEGRDTRQRLIDSARELIFSRGYADAGVQAICEHAGAKKGSFYHFFPSKKDLALAVLDDLFATFQTDILERSFRNDIPPMQRFARMVEMLYRFQKETADSTGRVLGCPFGNFAMEMSTQDEDIRLKVSMVFDEIQTAIQKTLIEAEACGDIIGGIDIAATAAAMNVYLEGVVLMAKTRNDADLIKSLAPALVNIRILQH